MKGACIQVYNGKYIFVNYKMYTMFYKKTNMYYINDFFVGILHNNKMC